jgi:guanosine-3',5'-bis(diphosphate) 3'-pyrophosphohydrolase
VAETLEESIRPVLHAIAFAARAHDGQRRKDKVTPYVSHVFRVCFIVRHLFGVTDPHALTAAALHDTVEDTRTDFDDLKEEFGEEVAGWVAALSKDKRLEERPREDAYVRGLVQSSWQVKVCKLADVVDNLLDSVHTEPHQRAKTFKRSHHYLDELRVDLPEEARRPWEIASELLAEMEAQETGRGGGA